MQLYIVVTMSYKYRTYLQTVKRAEGMLKESLETSVKVNHFSVRLGALAGGRRRHCVCLT